MILWATATAIGLAVVYGLNVPIRTPGDVHSITLPDIGNETVELSLAANAIYGGFHRFAWAVAVGWVIFACCRGYGGIELIQKCPWITSSVLISNLLPS